MSIEEIRTLLPLADDKPDDLLIVCTSFEERCWKSLLIAEKYKAEYVIVINYDAKEQWVAQRRAVQRLRDNAARVAEAAKKCARKGVIPIRCLRRDPLDGYAKLADALTEIGVRSRTHPRITLDVSVLTKSYLLVLLKALESVNGAWKRVVYSEPAAYYPDRLTVGVSSISYVPLFCGRTTSLKPDLLVAFLGFEGERAFAIWEHYEADHTIALVGSPGYRPRYPGTSRDLNRSLLGEYGVESQEVPTRDPDMVATTLKDIWRRFPDHNLLLAPLGTKLQALGLYLFLRDNPECGGQVVYATPAAYYANYYAKGSGKVYQKTISLPQGASGSPQP